MSQPTINPEWVKLLEADLEAAKRDRDDWLWCYSLLTGILQRHPGWEEAKECRVFGSDETNLEGSFLAKQANRTIDGQRKEIDKLTELNEDKFKTINAYCRMASMDKWKIQKLVEAIDQYCSAAGYSEATKILENARADVINAKTALL